MKRFLTITGIAAMVSVALSPVYTNGADKAAQEHHHGPTDVRAAANGNPLKEEMRRLDIVFRDIVSGVALGNGLAVHTAVEEMHGSMEKTREALHSGKVKPPRNADKIQEFLKQDKEFHANLEALAKAAHKNDKQKMTALTKKLLDGCVKCHGVFR